MNEDKKTNTGGLDTAPDFENFEKADVSEELLEEANGKYRDLKGFPRYLAFGIAVATTLIIFYTAFAGVFLPMVQRSIIICSMSALTFLWCPTTKKSKFDRSKVPVYDWIMVAMSIFSFVWTVSNNERFMTRVPFASEIQTLDYVVALALVFMIIEVGRRTLGISISIITPVSYTHLTLPTTPYV